MSYQFAYWDKGEENTSIGFGSVSSTEYDRGAENSGSQCIFKEWVGIL